jgi:hypothetical protein
MKGVTVLAVLSASLLAVPHAAAQDADNPRLMRGDISGTVGWITLNKSEVSSYNNWRTEGLFSVRAGWYWTNHLKTSIDASITTDADVYVAGQSGVFPGVPLYPSSRYTFRGHHLGISQAYQFRHNQWVHPFLAAGVDILAERRSQREDPLFFYDQVTRQTRVLRDAIEHPDRTDVRTRAMISGGLKAYVSRKAFVLTDVRVTFGRRAEELHWGFGVGADF